jgi:hypothetical protein
MVKIFAHGFQNGYMGKNYVLQGHDVVVCPSCINLVKAKNSQANIMVIAFGLVGFLIVLFITFIQRG